MSDSATFIAGEIARLLEPVVDAARGDQFLLTLLERIGYDARLVSSAPLAPIAAALGPIATAVEALSSVTSASSLDDLAHHLAAIAQILDSLRKLPAALGTLGAAVGDLGTELLSALGEIYFFGERPAVGRLAVLLGLIDPPDDAPESPVVVDDAGNLVRLAYQLPRIHVDRLLALLGDPAGALRDEYFGPHPLAMAADARFAADRLFPRVRDLLRDLGVNAWYGLSVDERQALGPVGPAEHMLTVHMTLPGDEQAGGELGASLMLSSAEEGDLGLVVVPYGTLTLSRELIGWTFSISVGGGVQALAVGRHGVQFQASGDTSHFHAAMAAERHRLDDQPAMLLGAADGTHLELGAAKLSASFDVAQQKPTLALAATVDRAALVLRAGDGDGFLQKVLPDDGLRLAFQLGLGWTTGRGLSFSGGAGLEIDLPVEISVLGAVTLHGIHLALAASDKGLSLGLTGDAEVEIGPIAATIERMGLAVEVSFPNGGGNLGAAQLAIAFRPPRGVGLEIDSAGLSGGGFLAFDPADKKYSGMLAFEFADIALTAFGLLTTRFPDGKHGFSLVAVIDAEFPPLQLGFGFTLNGVGGLLGINRTASTDVLRAGLKSHALDAIMFPQDPIQHAPEILAQLDAAFPPAEGRYVFGPMAKLGWGTPTVLSVELALIFELPLPLRLILLAELTSCWPHEELPLVEIHVNALGVLDLGAGEASLDATLYHSRIVDYAMSGDMALRVRWHEAPTFLLAIGGFHPRFQPPPGFPTLDRVAIDLSGGAFSRLRLEGYLALTSNSFQIGAHLDAFIGLGDFGLEGTLGFDALLHFAPFHFSVELSGSVALKAGSTTLMSLRLDALLEGPSPWHARGSVQFGILFITITLSFDTTFGTAQPDQPLLPVDVEPLVRAQLADPHNWSGRLQGPSLVTLRALPPGDTEVRVHPAAVLSGRQRVAPLGIALQQFGQAPISGRPLFAVQSLAVNGKPTAFGTATDLFAPAQYFALSDEEKLTRPSFDALASGVELGADAVAVGPTQDVDIGYHTLVIDALGAPARDGGSVQLGARSLTTTVAASGAGRRTYEVTPLPVAARATRYVAVSTLGLRQETDPELGIGAGVSYSAAVAALERYVVAHPERRGLLQIVAREEASP